MRSSKPSFDVMPIIVCIVTLIAVFGMFAAVAHGQEQQRLVVVISTNPQAAPLLAQNCTQVSETTYQCVLSASNIDDLSGYDNVVVLARTTFLSIIQR